MDALIVLIVPLAVRRNTWLMLRALAAWLHAARKLVLNMWLRGDGTQRRARNGRVDAAGLAHERSVLATNPAAARERFNLCYSGTDWSFPVVRGSDSRRLPPSSTALVGIGGGGWHFTG
jgi:hypothetical protein